MHLSLPRSLVGTYVKIEDERVIKVKTKITNYSKESRRRDGNYGQTRSLFSPLFCWKVSPILWGWGLLWNQLLLGLLRRRLRRHHHHRSRLFRRNRSQGGTSLFGASSWSRISLSVVSLGSLLPHGISLMCMPAQTFIHFRLPVGLIWSFTVYWKIHVIILGPSPFIC